MRTLTRMLAGAAVLMLAACAEDTPTAPPVSAAARPADQAALEARINGLIVNLFAPKDRGARVVEFARIKAALAAGRNADAQAAIVAFVGSLIEARDASLLLDPNGSAPPSLEEAFRDLVNSVSEFGGLTAPLPPAPFADDGAIAVVGPAGGTVVSSTGFGGVAFPPGALPDDVIVVVSRLPDPAAPRTGPLPTALDQYPLFYDFTTTPVVPQFAEPVIVGICQLEVGTPFGPPTQTVADRLQLAHPNPANPSTVELLERVAAPFIDCSSVTLADLGRRGAFGRALGLLADGGSLVWSLFEPSVAWAIHGGLGGKTRSFSPFGAVDPGDMLVGVCPAAMTGVTQTYPTMDLALANVAPGGTIRICPHSITIPATYVVAKPVTIEADVPASRPVFTMASGVPVGFQVNPAFQGLVTFRALEFTLGGAVSAIDLGVVQGQGVGNWWQVTVEDSRFTMQAGFGRAVRAFATSYANPRLTIRNNEMSGGTFPIVTLTGSATSTIEVLSNSFSGTHSTDAVLIQAEASARIEGNTFTGTCGAGCIRVLHSTNTLIKDNVLTIPAAGAGLAGIWVSGSPGGTTTITGNTITATGGGGPASDPQSYAFDSAAVVIARLGPSFPGGGDVAISGNVMANATAGIRVLGPGYNVTGTDNVVSNVLTGLALENPTATGSSLTISSTDFTGYFTPLTLAGAIPPNAVNAQCNWWGSASGPQNIAPGTPAGALSPFATAPVANGAGGPCNGMISQWTSVGAGSGFSCALRTDGAPFCWGANGSGQLGNGTTTPSPTPVAVSGGQAFTTLAVGDQSACGLTAAGLAYCWGSNLDGQLGAGLPTGAGQFSSSPTAVSGGLTFTTLRTGLATVCGVDSSGATWCWGNNNSGQLGSGVVGTDVAAPAQVTNSATLGFQEVDPGFYAACARTGAGAVYCWGGLALFGNGAGGGTTTTPTAAAGGETFQRLEVGSAYACGLTPAGTARCWSFTNTVGETGTGSPAAPTTPTPVAGGLTFQTLGVNDANTILAHTCAVTPSGDPYCWGSNRGLQLGANGASTCTFGNLTFECSYVPVPVGGGLKVQGIAAGNEHTCAVGTDRAVYCWGTNTSGQLGDGTTTGRITPARIANP